MAAARLALVGMLAICGTASAQYGPLLSGSGPVSRSMAGVAAASPLSPSGAVYWNPATLTGFERSETDFGLELLLLDTRLSSQFPAGSLGPAVPPVALSGQTRSNSTVYPLPNVGTVYRPEGSRWAYGLGVTAAAGFGVDYPGQRVNPILTPRPPAGVGVGPVFSDYQVLQISPAAAYQLTDRLSVGGGPIVNLGRLQFDPGLFLPPGDANGDGFGTYPGATHTRTAWGGGFSLGLYYTGDGWATGVGYKSPQWFESYRFNLTDELGRPQGGSVRLDLPTVVSWGLAYTGLDRWVFATDLRYLGFGQARGFGGEGFRADGSAGGLGFRDTFAVAVGAQFRATERLAVRAGYSYGGNPIPGEWASVNVASPTTIKHIVTCGMSWSVTEDFALSAAYLHGFDSSVSGPLRTPLGPVPGTSVGSSTGFDSVSLGASVKFGPAARGRVACAESPAAGGG